LAFIERHHLPTNKVEPETLLAFQEHLTHAEKGKSNSVRRKVIGVRQFFRYLAESRNLSGTPFDDVPIPGRIEILPKESTLDKVEKILEMVAARPETLKSTRDCAIVRLLAFEGLKAHEVIELEWRDFYHGSDPVTLMIRGQRARAIQPSPSTVEALLR